MGDNGTWRAAARVMLRARRGGGLRARIGAIALACLVFCTLAAMPARAAAPVGVETVTGEGYGRFVLTFTGEELLPQYSVSTANGVLVIEFDEPIKADVSRISLDLATYTPVARSDPDGRGLRFALAQGVKVHTIEAGEKLFVDLLPPTWSGLPPALPPEVVADLARRAEAALKAMRDAERANPRKITPKLSIRVGNTPTFSRFVFSWNLPFDTLFLRQKEMVSLTFNHVDEVDLSDIRAHLPPFVDDIRALATDDGKLKILIDVPPAADVRGFREDDTYVVDVSGRLGGEAASPEAAALREAIEPVTPSGVTEMVVAPADPGTPLSAPVAPMPLAPMPEVAEPAAPAPAVPALAIPTPAVPAAADTVTRQAAAMPPAAADLEPVAAGGAATIPVPRARPAPGGAPVAASQGPVFAPQGPSQQAEPAVAAPATAANAPVVEAVERAPDRRGEGGVVAGQFSGVEQSDVPFVDTTVKVEVQRIGTINRLTFSYKKPVDAALFSREGAIWLVFDDPMPVELDAIRTGLSGIARSVDLMKPDGAQALRIEMVDPLLATLSPDGTYWVVTIGDAISRPTRPLALMRSVRTNGNSAIDIAYRDVGRAVEIVDPAVGDRIVAVTGHGDPQGLVKAQDFADVRVLPSAFGVALLPRFDDLTVTVRPGEGVAVERPGGLSLSLSFPAQADDVFAEVFDQRASLPVGSDESLIDSVVDPANYWARKHDLERSLAAATDEAGRVLAWQRLVAFYLANGLGVEAKAALDVTGSIRPEETTQPAWALQSGAALVLMHRPHEALKLLSDSALETSPEAAFWRTIAHVEAGDQIGARRDMPRGEAVLGEFPRPLQDAFLVAAATASIEANDFGTAMSMLRQISRSKADATINDRIDILNARIADAAARSTDAMALLSRVVKRDKGRLAAEAALRLVTIQRREGVVTLPQAVERLEGLAASWRGDEQELKTLRQLARFLVESGNYRRAFEVMRTADTVNPDSDTTRLLNSEMSAAFSSLFLDGKADELEPLTALALYYDFKELTPIGTRGDEMVRRLADRLVDVDLLAQAQELLKHQIDNRLKGVARAQVAADLAMIYLLDRKPDRALIMLARTRQAQLPASVERQRRLVEAQALSETSKTDLALEVLASLSGVDAERTKAATLWKADRYQEAAEQFERLLATRWSDAVPLDEQEQDEVLKAAVAYVLADDEIGRNRLREKFTAKMASSPRASLFAVLTGPIDRNGDEFRTIAANIAAIDGMRAFLTDYRKQYLGAPAAPAAGAATSPSADAGGGPQPGVGQG
mgnify:CR=1 FL=1